MADTIMQILRPSAGEKRRRQRLRLYERQGGKCFYCKCQMSLRPPNLKPSKFSADECTVEHLDDRYSPDRGKRAGEYRRVAACWQCNHDRSIARTAALPAALRSLIGARGKRPAPREIPSHE